MDPKFRDRLPIEYQDEVIKFLDKPGCGCNKPLYKRILIEQQELLKEYFPTKEGIDDLSDELQQNNWSVINCSASELAEALRKLPPGRKQIAVARYEDQVTVIVNELDM